MRAMNHCLWLFLTIDPQVKSLEQYLDIIYLDWRLISEIANPKHLRLGLETMTYRNARDR